MNVSARDKPPDEPSVWEQTGREPDAPAEPAAPPESRAEDWLPTPLMGEADGLVLRSPARNGNGRAVEPRTGMATDDDPGDLKKLLDHAQSEARQAQLRLHEAKRRELDLRSELEQARRRLEASGEVRLQARPGPRDPADFPAMADDVEARVSAIQERISRTTESLTQIARRSDAGA